MCTERKNIQLHVRGRSSTARNKLVNLNIILDTYEYVATYALASSLQCVFLFLFLPCSHILGLLIGGVQFLTALPLKLDLAISHFLIQKNINRIMCICIKRSIGLSRKQKRRSIKCQLQLYNCDYVFAAFSFSLPALCSSDSIMFFSHFISTKSETFNNTRDI